MDTGEQIGSDSRAGQTCGGLWAIPWSQSTLDGLRAADLSGICIGAHWSWQGAALRIGGAFDAALTPSHSSRSPAVPRRMQRRIAALPGMGASFKSGLKRHPYGAGVSSAEGDAPLTMAQVIRGDTGEGMVITDGIRQWDVALIRSDLDLAAGGIGGNGWLALFAEEPPLAGSDLWVVCRHRPLRRRSLHGGSRRDELTAGGFCPETKLLTPGGPRAIADLRPGDLVETVDAGPLPLLCVIRRRVSGARLALRPELRPVTPGGAGLLCAPGQRLLLCHPQAADLFDAGEGLVTALDLAAMGGSTTGTGQGCIGADYLLPVFAEPALVHAGESVALAFHPDCADLSRLDPADQRALIEALPEIGAAPGRFGAMPRRALRRAEVALLARSGGQIDGQSGGQSGAQSDRRKAEWLTAAPRAV